MRWLKGLILAATPLSTPALAGETVTYTYDALGRLIAGSHTGDVNNGQVTSITFDAAGNRSNYTVTGGAMPPTLSISGGSANEGSSLTFVVTRSGMTSSAVSASWTTSNGSAVAGTNYTASSGTVNFAAGATSATITVPTVDDHIATANLTMSVTLSAPSGIATLGTATATGTINNIDASAVLAIASTSANEGAALNFTVTRSGNTASPASATWNTSNGTAVAGTNYSGSSGTVSFAPNVNSATISVATLDDYIANAGTAMSVTLSSPSTGVTLGTAIATGTINNIDAPAVLSIASASANEGTPLSFTVTRSGNTTPPASATWSTANGTAIAGTNYTASSGTVSFAGGATSSIISVPTIDDHVVSANLAMSVTLSSPSVGASLSTSSATGTINNIETGWSATLTSGTGQSCGLWCVVYNGYFPGTYGYGSLSNTTWNGYSIKSIISTNSLGTLSVSFSMAGTASAPANSTWTSISIPGVGTLGRSAATYATSGTAATWTWSNSGTVTSGTVTIQ